MQHLESQIQQAIVQWAHYNKGKYPELELLFSIPNGGKRSPRTAVIMKLEGVKSGIPDLCLPVARHGCHALYLEVKAPKGYLSANQKRMFPLLQAQKNEVIIIRTVQEGIDYLTGWLS